MSASNPPSSISENATQNNLVPEENTRDDIEEDIANLESYLVITYHDYKLGIAVHRIGYDKIELLHEVYEYYDFSYIKIILHKIEPTDVVISSKCDPCLVNFLKAFSLNINEPNPENELLPDTSIESDDSAYAGYHVPEADNQTNFRFKLHILSNRLFLYEQCKTRVLSMNLPQMANMIDTNERFIYLTSNINFSQINTIRSLGVLLYVLEKNPSFNNCVSRGGGDINTFAYLNFHYVTIDQTTFEALEIFQQEWHPSTMKKGIYKKEGLSVFGIFNICSSKLGSLQLKKIFQQPITDYDILVERQITIEYFIIPANKNFKDILVDSLKQIKDITPIFNRFKSFNFQFCDFELLRSIIVNMIHIRNSIAKVDHKLTLFSQITKVFTNELDEICNCLRMIIDFDKSVKNGIEIHAGIDDELDDLRMMINNLPEILNRVLLDESEENNLLALNLNNLTNVYVPQIGFLLAIPLMEAQKVPNPEDYGLETIFCANDRTFYKNKKMKEFDTYYGDITFNIAEQTRKVLVRCTEFIFQRKKTIKSSILLCAQLDAMIAMAQTAINYNYVRPTLNCSGAIKIEQGRHPLYELIGSSFTPNPFVSGDSKMALVFGPNNCGKSVYLKQVSLIIYLAHIGSCVPASSAEITIVDQILTRIRTPESISTQLSSFKHDLNQIIMATKYASSKSLVVIDFFGKGTLSIDGFSLLSACIKYWANSYNQPHLIISSQFNLMSGLSHSSAVKFFTFQTISGVNSFSLVECENQNQSENSSLLVQVYDDKPQSIEQILHESLDKELQDSFPELNNKYQKYAELADFVTNESQSGEFIDQVLLLIKALTKSYHNNKYV